MSSLHTYNTSPDIRSNNSFTSSTNPTEQSRPLDAGYTMCILKYFKALSDRDTLAVVYAQTGPSHSTILQPTSSFDSDRSISIHTVILFVCRKDFQKSWDIWDALAEILEYGVLKGRTIGHSTTPALWRSFRNPPKRLRRRRKLLPFVHFIRKLMTAWCKKG